MDAVSYGNSQPSAVDRWEPCLSVNQGDAVACDCAVDDEWNPVWSDDWDADDFDAEWDYFAWYSAQELRLLSEIERAQAFVDAETEQQLRRVRARAHADRRAQRRERRHV